MRPELAVQRGEIVFQANYAEPLFALFKETTLVEEAYRRFAPLGLTLADINYQTGDPTAADLALECGLPRVPATIKYLLDRVEVSCLATERIQGNIVDRIAKIVLLALDLVGRISTFEVNTYTFGMSLHGQPGGADAKEIASGFTQASSAALGPAMGGGAIFYYGQVGSRTSSALTVDLSALVPGGLFLRAFGVWDGKQVPLLDLPGTVSAFVFAAADAAGLSLYVGGNS